MLALVAMCCGAALGRIRPSNARPRVIPRSWVWVGIVVALLMIRFSVHLAWLTPWLWVATQAALIAFLIANRGVHGSLLVAGGIALNAVVIAVNRGMPVSASAARIAGVELPSTAPSGHTLLGIESPLGFLGDILPFAPAGQVLSIGDLLMLVGLAVLSYTATASWGPSPSRFESSEREKPVRRRGSGIRCQSIA